MIGAFTYFVIKCIIWLKRKSGLGFYLYLVKVGIKMNIVINFIINHKDDILVGVIITLVTGFCGGIISNIYVVVKSKFSSKPLPEPKEQAIYLSTPKRILDDNCIGRNELLETVLDKITDSKKLFIKKCISITGEEGIGKTLFCYMLFRYYLRESSVYLGWIECNGKHLFLIL